MMLARPSATSAAMRALVTLLDDPRRPVVDCLEVAQAISAGFPAAPCPDRPAASGEPANEEPLVQDLLVQLG
ncbi:hypothetical protein [Kocuria rhizophila]|uniref:hypothetical protein n=2 Tax=Kocuria rhizophila TaxID=72000 RepID=UPI0019097FF3|nr:hypothetical protein [Kocuria rhizophila]MBK4120028.1 hypothetical protein [Kocuria rhizophila]